MSLVREDSFEAYSTGAPPGGFWSVTAASGGGAVTVEEDPAATRGKVLKIAESNGAGATTSFSEAVLALPASRASLVLVFEFYAAQSTRTVYFGFYANGTRYDVLALWTDGTIRYKRASDSTWVALTTATSYTAVSWTKVRLVLNRAAGSGELVMVTVNELDKLSAALDLPAIGADIESFAVATEETEDSTVVYLHDVQVLERSAQIAGIVRDHTGAPISGARVVLFRHTTHAQLATALTNSYGVYAFAVDAGIYVMACAYHPSLATKGGAAAPWIWAGAS